MNVQLVHVGFGNILAMNRVVAMSSPDSAPIKRLIQEARTRNAVIDLTSGRRTKAVIVLDTGDVVLTALAPETIASRASSGQASGESKNTEVKDTHG